MSIQTVWTSENLKISKDRKENQKVKNVLRKEKLSQVLFYHYDGVMHEMTFFSTMYIYLCTPPRLSSCLSWINALGAGESQYRICDQWLLSDSRSISSQGVWRDVSCRSGDLCFKSIAQCECSMHYLLWSDTSPNALSLPLSLSLSLYLSIHLSLSHLISLSNVMYPHHKCTCCSSEHGHRRCDEVLSTPAWWILLERPRGDRAVKRHTRRKHQQWRRKESYPLRVISVIEKMHRRGPFNGPEDSI